MANSIDKRIVEMQFDNARFEQNMNQSISTLDKLKNALNLNDAAKGFNKLEKEANSMDFSRLEYSISKIEQRFSALGIAGATVITDLTHKAIGAVEKLNSAVFGQMKSGGISRALNLEHASFMLNGLLQDSQKVAEIMKEGGPVQNAVKGTAYGLDAAANAAAQFVASGVKDTDKLESALTAISGAAAMTGSSYEDISNIFTTVAGNGRLMASELNRFSARGVNAAATLAEQLGKTETEIRQMVSKGKIDFETFADAMNKAFGKQAKKANETYTGALSNVKAALSRIGAKVATNALEDLRRVFVKLIDVVNGISKALDPMIGDITKALDTITDFTEALLENEELINVYTNAIDLLRNSLAQIAMFVMPIRDAFKDIFPSKSLSDIAHVLDVLKRLTGMFFLTGDNADRLKRIFRGLFSIVDIIGQAFSAVFRVMLYYSNEIGAFISNVLEAAATVGDFFNGLRLWIKENDLFARAIMTLIDVIVNLKTFAVNSFNEIKAVVSPFFNYISKGIENLKASIQSLQGSVTILDKIKERFKGLSSIGKIFGVIFEGIKSVGAAIAPLLKNLGDFVGKGISEIFKDLYEIIHSGSGFDGLMDLFNTIFGAGIVASIERMIAQFVNLTSRGTNLVGNISFMLKELCSSLQVFQAKIKADMLASIAKSVGILTLSIIGLSLVDSDKLMKALAAIGLLMAMLAGTRIALDKFMTFASSGGSVFDKLLDPFKNWIKLGAQANFLLKLAAAIGIMAGSLLLLSTIPYEKLHVALSSFVVMMAGFIVLMAAYAKFSDKFKEGSADMLIMAASIAVISSALKKLSSADPTGLAVGVIALAGVMATIGVALSEIKAPKGGALLETAGAIMMVVSALTVLSPALALLAAMKPERLAVGTIALASMLGAISASLMIVEGDNLMQTAAAISLIAVAIGLLAPSIALLSAMDPAGVAVGVIALASMLGAISASLMVIDGDNLLVTAGAIAIIALAIGSLAPGLALLSAMDPVGMAVGVIALATMLGAIAASLIIIDSDGVIKTAAAIGIISIALVNFVPSLIALSLIPWPKLLTGVLGLAGALVVIGGAAFLLQKFNLGPTLMIMGQGLLMISGSVALVGVGLMLIATALGIIGVTGVTAAAGLTAIIVAIGAALPNLLTGLAAGIAAFIVALGAMAGAIGLAIGEIVAGIINGLRIAVKPLLTLIEEVGLGIIAIVKSWAPALCDAVITIVDELLIALDAHTESIVTHLVSWSVTLIESLATAIEANGQLLSDAIVHLLTAAFNVVITEFLPTVVNLGLDLIGALIKGINQALAELMKLVVDIVADILKAFGIDSDMIDAGVNAIKGFIDGMVSWMNEAVDKAIEMAKGIVDAVCKVLRIESPSKIMEWIGEMIDKGAANGIENNQNLPINAMDGLGNGLIDSLDSKMAEAETVAGQHAQNIGNIIDAIYKKMYGLTKAQAESAASEDTKRNDMELARKAQLGLVTIPHKEKDTSTATETKALGGNTGATKKNTKAKKENEKANEKKNKSIDEESEALNEETEAAEDNREEILALAEEIEVITKEFDKSFNHLQSRDNFKIVKNLTKAFSTFWSKGLGENGWKKASQINKAFKQVNKNIKGTTQAIKKGAYAFDETGKYTEKLSKRISKSNKKIEAQVMKTGNTIIRTYQGQAVVFNKVGNSVQKTTMRLAKNVKNLGQYFNELREFQAEMEKINPYSFLMDTDNAYDYITKLRKIEKYYVKLGQMPQKIQDFMLRINEKLSPFNDSLNTLGKRLDGVNSYMNQKSSATAYVQDAFISLAATLYDGSEAANEYETEHAKLLFLLEHGEATIEEVEEHFQSYISRIMEALEEYRNSIEENLRGSFDIWNEFDKKIEDSNKNFLDTIESQIAGYNQWADMLFELSKRGVDMNILKMLTDEGVSSYGKLKSLLGMTANQIALFNQRYAESENAIKKARDTSLAALANATTRATQRAAAESSKNAKTQLKQSKAVAKRLIDDAKAVAENQARYRSLSAREEELYLQKITGAEKEAYQARLREVKKAMKAEQKAAKKEETKRAREKKVATILSEVKSFEKLRKQYHKYLGDAKMLKEINKQVAKSLENIKDKIKAFDGKSVKEMNYSWLAFAETLESTGNEANDYLTEMSERLQKFVEEVESATKAGTDMFKVFEKADKQTFTQMYAGIKSQILARGNIGTLFNKVIKMGFSQDAINYLNEIKSDLPEFYATLETWSKLTSGQVSLVNQSIKTLTDSTNNLNSLIENGFANTSTAAAQIAVENAQKALDTKAAALDKVKKEANSAIKDATKAKTEYEKELQANTVQTVLYEAMLASGTLTKKEKKEYKTQLEGIKQERATLETGLNTANQRINKANETIEKAQLEYDAAQANLNAKKQKLAEENSILAKKQILDSANNKLNTAKSELDSVQKSVNAQNKDLQKQIANWQTELVNWQQNLAAAKTAKNKSAQNEAKNNITAITQQISAAQAQIQGNTESLTKAQINYDNALKNATEAQNAYNKALADDTARANAERIIQEALLSVVSYEKLSKALKDYSKNSDLIKRLNEGIKDSMSGITGAVDQFGKRWRNITNLHLKDTTAAFSEISNAFLRFADTLADANEELSSFDDYIAARKQALSDYRDTLYDTIKGQVNLFEEFKRYSGEEATSADTYLANMQTQIKGLEDWLTNLEKLAKRGVSGDIIAMFASEGQNSFEKVEAFANATQEELIEFVGQYDKYLRLLDEAADRAMATVGSTYTDAARAATDALLAQFNGAIDRSKVEEEAYETGVMIINGVKDGIGHVMPELMADVADSAEEAAAKKAGAAIGKAINDGIVKAVSDNVASTVNAAIEKFKMAVDAVNSYVQQNLQSEYTITIHVDASEIDAAIARMNAAIGGINANAGATQQAVVTSQANQQSPTVEPMNAEGTVNNVTLNYTQNNTSPVALSRTEIYRQTQNQLSTINGAINAAMG